MKVVATFAALAVLAGFSPGQVITSVPGCPAPVYFGVCNPYVPGVFIGSDDTGAISVLSTWHNGPAEEAGICPGDKIVAVNELSATGSNWDRLVRELISESPTPVVLRVRRGQQQFGLRVPRVRETALAALSGEKFVSAISGSLRMPPDYKQRVVAKGVTQDHLRALMDFRSRPTQSLPDATVPVRPQFANAYFTGIAAMYDEERHEAMVAEVSYPSPAFSAGVYPGDLIISIQDLPLAKFTREQLVQALAPADPKPLSLALMRSGKRLIIRLLPVRYGDALGGIGKKLTEFGAAPFHCPD